MIDSLHANLEYNHGSMKKTDSSNNLYTKKNMIKIFNKMQMKQKILSSFSLHVIIDKKDLSIELKEKIIKSDIILADCFENSKEKFFILSFDHIILFVPRFRLIYKYLNQAQNVKIFSFSNEISMKLKHNKNEIKIINESYQNEANTLLQNVFFFDNEMDQIWKIALQCVVGYLIINSHKKSRIDRIDKYLEYFDNQIEQIDLKESDYIVLDYLGNGSSANVYLIYHIEKEQLFALKILRNNENSYLLYREKRNYLKIHHPFLPKFYGISKLNSNDCLIIEYIEGKTLSEIKNIKLTFDQKVKIIFQIMIIIYYLHQNKMILRDLKPDNIIIDHNLVPIIIDFGQMIENIDTDISTNCDFCYCYIAPEIKKIKKFSSKSDIYSLGILIYFILFEEPPTFLYNSDIKEMYSCKFEKQFPEFIEMFKKCTSLNQNERPDIKDLIKYFYHNFFQLIINKICEIELISCKNNENIEMIFKYLVLISEPNNQFSLKNMILLNDEGSKKYSIDMSLFLSLILYYNYNNIDTIYIVGILYLHGAIVKQNINKAIQYISLAANQNYEKALIELGNLYYLGQYMATDIKSALYYYNKAADLNNSQAQEIIGMIYYMGTYVPCDIKKSIYYFTKSANQGNDNSQTMLGYIYTLKDYDSYDINKSIKYFEMAANRNNSIAQHCLGYIYFTGSFNIQDINKGIHYYLLSANQNYAGALFNLGQIYKEGKYVKKNINKAIEYYTKAADLNFSDALNNLGIIYLNGKYIPSDIDKAIHYLSIAAKQNFAVSLLNLGIIYYENIYIIRDIDKAIYFLTKASNQNVAQAQYILGFIFYEGKYIKKDLTKAFHYWSLSSDQEYNEAQFAIGNLYYFGEYFERNINKAIYYYTLASNDYFIPALYNLGIIYYDGQYVPQNINKAIFYFSLAAKLGNGDAQFKLGTILFENNCTIENMNNAIYWITQSAKNNNINANFIMGYLYHDGLYFGQQDINKAIKFYKEASSFNNQFAKNNLAIIYKYGFENIVQKNICASIEYLKEAIHKKNDFVSMYNLANIYIYEDLNMKFEEKSIDLLIKSFKNGVLPSLELLCLLLIKNYGLNIAKFRMILKEYTQNIDDLLNKIIFMINTQKLNYQLNFENRYEQFRNIDFLYNHKYEVVGSKYITNKKLKQITQIIDHRKKVNSHFYEGFEINVI